jgi:hypothetical protein
MIEYLPETFLEALNGHSLTSLSNPEIIQGSSIDVGPSVEVVLPKESKSGFSGQN